MRALGRAPGRTTLRRRATLADYFFAFDLLVGFSLPVYFHLRHRSGRDDAAVLSLFWLGVGIGLVWEVPIFLSAILAEDPIVTFIREPPLHPLIFMVAHAFWDGGLFLAGLALVRSLCTEPVLARFRWQELAVLIGWGQGSELLVEIEATAGA